VTAPFNPNVPDPSGLVTGSHATLPSGTLDVYGLGQYGDQTLYLGQSTTTTQRRGPRGSGPDGLGVLQNVTTTAPSTKTALQYMRQFASLSVSDPQAYAALQQQLYNAGFYGTSKPRYGIYSGTDAGVLKNAIVGYLGVVNPDNPNPLTFADYLDHASKQGEANASSNPAPARAPLQLTDPKALEQTLQAASQNALHRDLSKDELAHFVSAFHGKEAAAYNSYGAGQTTTSPDQTGEAKSFVEDGHEAEANGARAAGYMDVLNSLLGVRSAQ
jgi:hypothetical protein